MSLTYRINRINTIASKWKLKKIHPLIAIYQFPVKEFEEFKTQVKNYLCKALKISFDKNDKIFLKRIDRARKNRTNVTPNGAVVPKKEFQLEYNIVLRSWCELVKSITKEKPSLLTLFRITPNIRIKFGKELSDNKKRGLNTSLPHSDAWVEGPWGMNCFIPLFGDYKKNNLLYYEPINFNEKFLRSAKTYYDMQWVKKDYRKLKIVPKPGNVYISDYATIHQTFRKKNAKTRISIDTTLFVGNHKPMKDRIKEYNSKIPAIGLDYFVNAGQYEKDKPAEKKTIFSHYTSKVLKLIRLN